MIYYDNSSKNLIRNLGNDTRIKVREVYSEIEFYTTPHEMLVANSKVNKLFMDKGRIAVIDVLMAFEIPSIDISNAPDVEGILYGWNFACFFGFDVPWITFFISLREIADEIIFTLGYEVDPCMEYSHCTGDDCASHCYSLRDEIM